MIYTIMTYVSCLLIVLYSRLESSDRLKIVCCVFLLYATLRYDFGYDYFSYIKIINENDFYRFEPFQKILAYVSSEISPQLFIAVNSCIVILCIYKVYKKLSYVMPLILIGYILIFFIPIGFHLSVDRIRQFTSIFLLLYATCCSSKYSRLFVYTIAVCSHYASVIFFPIIFFNSFLYRPIPRYLQISLLIISVTFLPYVLPNLAPLLGRYGDYFVSYVSDDGNKMLIFYYLLFLSINLNYKYILLNKYSIYYYNIVLLGMSLYTAFAPFGVHLTRISSFLLLPIPILFAYLLSYKSKVYQYMVIGLIVIITIILHYLSSQNIDRDFLNNYDFFFLYNLSELNYDN